MAVEATEVDELYSPVRCEANKASGKALPTAPFNLDWHRKVPLTLRVD